MDSIEALARQLLGQPVEGEVERPDYSRLQRFLKTRQGQEAARSAIDRLVFNYNVGIQDSIPAHQQIVKSLEAIMSGASGYQDEISATDPINIAPAQQRGFSSQDY